MRRRVVVAVAVAGVLGLSGCSTAHPAPVPNVTFSTNGHSVTAPPLQYCDAHLRNCLPHANPPVFLPVPAGDSVRVAAPDAFRTTPWQVAARYRDGQGKEYVACSTLFTTGAQLTYTVTPPSGYQLVLIEVYQVAALLGAGSDTRHPTFANSGVWSMVATPPAGQQPELPKLGDNLCESPT